MAFTTRRIERIHIACWTSDVIPSHMAQILRELKEAGPAVKNQLMFGLAIVTKEAAKIPDANTRDYMIRTTKLIVPMCLSMHTVIDAPKHYYNVVVGGLRAMALVGDFLPKIYFEDRVGVALERISRYHKFNRDYVLGEIEKMKAIK